MGTDYTAYRTELDDFLNVLAQPGDDGLPFIIVGGQAANYWAGLYLEHEPRLRAHLPFTSKDLDLIGSRKSAQQVAHALSWTFMEPPVGGGPVQGVVNSVTSDKTLTVEFLTEIKGVPQDIIREFARENTIQPEGSRRLTFVRVLDPVMLLAGKVRNAVDIEQDRPEKPRQDVKHVAMLGLCIPHFLNDLRAQNIESQQIELFQKYIMVLRALKNSYSGRTFEAKYPGTLHWSELIPESIRTLPFADDTQAALRDLGTVKDY